MQINFRTIFLLLEAVTLPLKTVCGSHPPQGTPQTLQYHIQGPLPALPFWFHLPCLYFSSPFLPSSQTRLLSQNIWHDLLNLLWDCVPICSYQILPLPRATVMWWSLHVVRRVPVRAGLLCGALGTLGAGMELCLVFPTQRLEQGCFYGKALSKLLAGDGWQPRFGDRVEIWFQLCAY